MYITISNASDSPIYDQIARQIKNEILTGRISPGDALPSIRKLAQELRVSVITTKRAYDDLLNEGFLDSVQGKGFFVAEQNREFLREKKMRLIEEKLASAVDEAKLIGMTLAELQEMAALLFSEEE